MIINALLSRAASFLLLVDGYVPCTLLSVANQLAGTICLVSDGSPSRQPTARAIVGNSTYLPTTHFINHGLLQPPVVLLVRRLFGRRSFRSFTTSGPSLMAV